MFHTRIVIYEEAVDYLIDIAERVEDNSIRRKLKAYKKKPSGLRSIQLAAMFGMRKHAAFVDAIIADLREAASGYPQRAFFKRRTENS